MNIEVNKLSPVASYPLSRIDSLNRFAHDSNVDVYCGITQIIVTHCGTRRFRYPKTIDLIDWVTSKIQIARDSKTW